MGVLIFHLMQNRKKNFKQSLPPGKFFSDALKVARDNSIEDLVIMTKLPLSWLRKFRAGEITNPSVNRIEHILSTFGLL